MLTWGVLRLGRGARARFISWGVYNCHSGLPSSSPLFLKTSLFQETTSPPSCVISGWRWIEVVSFPLQTERAESPFFMLAALQGQRELDERQLSRTKPWVFSHPSTSQAQPCLALRSDEINLSFLRRTLRVASPGALVCMAALVAKMVKNLPAMQETRVRSLDWEIPLEKGMVIHFSVLACRIPWTEEPGGL